MRTLSAAEKAFLQSYFGNCLDVDRVALRTTLFGKRAWSPFGNLICLPKVCFIDGDQSNDVRLDDARIASVFAHEAAHVWQRQRGVAVTWQAFWLQIARAMGRCPYTYDRSISDPRELRHLFLGANVERQGQIVQDFVLRDQLGRPVDVYSDVANELMCERRDTESM